MTPRISGLRKRRPRDDMTASPRGLDACGQLCFEEPLPLRTADLRQIQSPKGNQETGRRQLDIDEPGISKHGSNFINAEQVTFVTGDFTREIARCENPAVRRYRHRQYATEVVMKRPMQAHDRQTQRSAQAGDSRHLANRTANLIETVRQRSAECQTDVERGIREAAQIRYRPQHIVVSTWG